MRQPGPAAGAVEDLIEALGRQRPPPVRALQHHEHPLGDRSRWSFVVEVTGHGDEETRRHRDRALMAALALRDEHPAFPRVQILQPQPQDLASAQAAQHHGLDHGPVPIPAQRRQQSIDFAGRQDPGQRPRGADQRDTLAGTGPLPAGGQTPRHRIGPHPRCPLGQQERIQARHTR